MNILLHKKSSALVLQINNNTFKQPQHKELRSKDAAPMIVFAQLWVQCLALHKLGVVLHAHNPAESETGKSEVQSYPQPYGKPGLYETVSKNSC